MNQDYLKLSRNSTKHGKHDYCMSCNYDEGLIKFFPKLTNKQVYDLSANYPLQSYKDLKGAIQKLFGSKNIILSAGCESIIVKICESISKDHCKVGVITPTFYRITDNLSKFTSIDWDNIENVDYNKFDYIFVVNPNTLNGQAISKKKLLNVVKSNPNIIFIIDETSILFLENWKQISLANQTTKNSNLLVISSLSKFFGLSGQRIGFATCSTKLLTRPGLGLETFPISNMSAFVANSIITNSAFLEFTRQRILHNKNEITNMIEKSEVIGLSPSINNCIYCYSKDRSKLHEILDKIVIVGLDLDCQKGIKQKGLMRLTIHGSLIRHKFLVNKLR